MNHEDTVRVVALVMREYERAWGRYLVEVAVSNPDLLDHPDHDGWADVAEVERRLQATSAEADRIPVRWRKGEPREGRIFPPLKGDHPLFEVRCPACPEALGNGEPIQLLVLGPGRFDECADAHAAGRWYSADALALHAACLGTDAAAISEALGNEAGR